jgi:hypothetical protein
MASTTSTSSAPSTTEPMRSFLPGLARRCYPRQPRASWCSVALGEAPRVAAVTDMEDIHVPMVQDTARAGRSVREQGEVPARTVGGAGRGSKYAGVVHKRGGGLSVVVGTGEGGSAEAEARVGCKDREEILGLLIRLLRIVGS